jgi:hypothetical protein
MPVQTLPLLDVIFTDGGFTYDVRSDSLLRVGEATGFMIAIPGTESLLGPVNLTRGQFADRFAALVASAPIGEDTYVGGWLSPERGYMIELSELHHCDRYDAVALGVERNQESILDLATGEFIATGGMGDTTAA